MILELDEKDLNAVRAYRLPSYEEIPDVGLYLNQTATYINRYLSVFPSFSITESMISNYVKKKLIDNPVKKQYSRPMICYLLFIALCKNVASLDDIQLLITLQKENKHEVRASYEFFKKEFESILRNIFGIDDELADRNGARSIEGELLEKLIAAIAHKIYVDSAFRLLRENKSEEK